MLVLRFVHHGLPDVDLPFQHCSDMSSSLFFSGHPESSDDFAPGHCGESRTETVVLEYDTDPFSALYSVNRSITPSYEINIPHGTLLALSLDASLSNHMNRSFVAILWK